VLWVAQPGEQSPHAIKAEIALRIGHVDRALEVDPTQQESCGFILGVLVRALHGFG
jgi:hypothetical protein